MTKRERNFVVLLLIIIIIFMSYMFVFKNQMLEIDEIESQIEADEVLIKSYERADDILKNLQKSKEGIEDVLHANYKDYLSEIKQEDVILLINEILLRSDIDVSSITFDDFAKGITEMLDYDIFNVSITLNGGYKEVMDFVRARKGESFLENIKTYNYTTENGLGPW